MKTPLPHEIIEGYTLLKTDTTHQKAEKRAEAIHSILTYEGPCTPAELMDRLGDISISTFYGLIRYYVNTMVLTKGKILYNKAQDKYYSLDNKQENLGFVEPLTQHSTHYKDTMKIYEYIKENGEQNMTKLYSIVGKNSSSTIYGILRYIREEPKMSELLTYDKKAKKMYLTTVLEETKLKVKLQNLNVVEGTFTKLNAKRGVTGDVYRSNVVMELISGNKFKNQIECNSLIDTLIEQNRLTETLPEERLTLPIVIPNEFRPKNTKELW